MQEYFLVSAQRRKQQLIKQGRPVADLSIGNPDLPPPPIVQETLCRFLSLPHTHGYQPNAGQHNFRNAISAWYSRFFNAGIDSLTQVLPLQGSRQGILQLSQTLLGPGDEVLVPDPGYPSYAFGAAMMGATARKYTLSAHNHFLPQWEELEAMDLSRVKLMWVNYPHMPTGARATEDFFVELVAFARRHNILVVNDHAYAFIRNNTPLSILSVEGADQVALELNSLSKNYNLAGWRLGFLAGNGGVISQLSQLKSHLDSGIALPLQQAAAEALGLGYNWFAPCNNEYNARWYKAMQLVHALGCEPAGAPSGMFVWARMPEQGLTSVAFVTRLLEEAGVLLAPGSLFGSQGEHHIRISLCASFETFDQALSQLSNQKINHTLQN